MVAEHIAYSGGGDFKNSVKDQIVPWIDHITLSAFGHRENLQPRHPGNAHREGNIGGFSCYSDFAMEQVAEARNSELKTSLRGHRPRPPDPKLSKRDILIAIAVIAIAIILIAVYYSGSYGEQYDLTSVRQTSIKTVHDSLGWHVETSTKELPGLAGKSPASRPFYFSLSFTAVNGTQVINSIESATPQFVVKWDNTTFPVTIENGSSRLVSVGFLGEGYSWSGAFEFLVNSEEYRSPSA